MPERPEYLSFFTEGGEVIYSEELRDADALIFDVDGTLVSSSFDRATVETVKILFRAFTGIGLDDAPLREALFRIKTAGGFANHWDIAYAIFMGLMSGLDELFLKGVVEKLEEVDTMDLVEISRAVGRVEEYKPEALLEGVKDVVDYVDERGVISVDEAFDRLYKSREKRDLLMKIKEIISYPGGPEKSLLSRTFEELYYGGKKFEELYEISPRFKIKTGLLSEERLLIRPDTVKFLKRKFGERIGLLTGKRRDVAKTILGQLIGSFFNKKACIFLEDCEGRSKPDPYLLKSVLRSLPGHSLAVYIGDSMEDLFLVKRFPDKKVKFIGVYGTSFMPGECMKLFLEKGADAVVPSVNDLKVLFG